MNPVPKKLNERNDMEPAALQTAIEQLGLSGSGITWDTLTKEYVSAASAYIVLDVILMFVSVVVLLFSINGLGKTYKNNSIESLYVVGCVFGGVAFIVLAGLVFVHVHHVTAPNMALMQWLSGLKR